MVKTPLTSIPGIGEATAHRLGLLGIPDAEALLAAPAGLLAGLPGFHRERAERVLNAAATLLVSAAASANGAQTAEPATDRPETRKVRGKADTKKSKAKSDTSKGKKKKEKKAKKKKDKKRADDRKTGKGSGKEKDEKKTKKGKKAKKKA